MAYARGNPPTKKVLKEWVAQGKEVQVFTTNGAPRAPWDGKVYLEGPWYPRVHTWYAEATMRAGVIIDIK